MCEQMDQEPDPERMPPEFADFPEDVQTAIIIFGKLGDKLVADIGYLGKDYTLLEPLLKGVHVYDRDIVIETLLRLDERTKKRSAEEMKRERNKLKGK